jgi:site-specific recombinase XerD
VRRSAFCWCSWIGGVLIYGFAMRTGRQRHLGHADIATTMIYLHVPQQRQADEIGRVFA